MTKGRDKELRECMRQAICPQTRRHDEAMKAWTARKDRLPVGHATVALHGRGTATPSRGGWRNLIRVAGAGRDDDAFTFRHGLLHAVTYRAIPKRRRAVLYMRRAERAAEAAGRSAFEDDEAVGHLEQPYHYLAQLAGDELSAPACIDRLVDRPTAGVTS